MSSIPLDLNTVGVSQPSTPDSLPKQKSNLGKAVLIAVLAIAAIALLYAEVKYGLVSYGISYAVANPWIIGALAIAAVIGIAYLVYSRGKYTQTNSSAQNPTPPSATQPTIRRTTYSLAPTEYTVANPASNYEYNAAIVIDPSLADYIRGHFPNMQENAPNLEAAQVLVLTRLLELAQKSRSCEDAYNIALSTNNATIPRDDWGRAQRDLLKFLRRRPLILYWLMNEAYID